MVSWRVHSGASSSAPDTTQATPHSGMAPLKMPRFYCWLFCSHSSPFQSTSVWNVKVSLLQMHTVDCSGSRLYSTKTCIFTSFHRGTSSCGSYRQGFVRIVHLNPLNLRTNWNILGVQERWLEWLNKQILECLNLDKYLIRFCLRTYDWITVNERTEGKNNISIY